MGIKRIWEAGFTKYNNGRTYMGSLDFGNGCRGFIINEDGSWETSYYRNSLQSGATIDRNTFSLSLKGRQIFLARMLEADNRMVLIVEWGDHRWSLNIGVEKGSWFIPHPDGTSKNGLGYSAKQNAICKYNFHTGFTPIIPNRSEFKFQGLLPLPRKADKPSSSKDVFSVANDHKERLYSNVSKGLCLYHDKDSSWSWFGESSYSAPGGFGILSRFFGYEKTFIFGSYKRNDYNVPFEEIENKLKVLYYDYSDSYDATMNYLHVRKLGEDIDMTFILYKNGNIKFTCGKINGSYVELEDFENVTLVEVKDNKIISRTKYKLQ